MIVTAEWLKTTPAISVIEALEDEGFEAFYVGGCVRDTLMGTTPKDIDIATSATPVEVAMVFEDRGMGVVPTGIKHGTVTVKAGGEAFEVTTYRHDVTTDGRNATVAFTRSVEEDGARRDFTVNALYMQKNGVVLDSSGSGIEDIMHRRIRFVGDAHTRCKEDYLRILRYFRFYARFGGGKPDAEALSAVRSHWHKLFEVVSAERVMGEIRSILSLPNPIPALVIMDDLEILRHLLGTRSYNDPHWMHALLRAEHEAGVSPDWHRRYTFLTQGTMPSFPISRAEENRLRQTHQSTPYGASPAIVAFQYRDPEIAMDAHLLRCAERFGSPDSREALDAEIERGLGAVLPVDGPAFFEHGIGPGRVLGWALHFAKEAFKASDLRATADQLIPVALQKVSQHHGKESLA